MSGDKAVAWLREQVQARLATAKKAATVAGSVWRAGHFFDEAGISTAGILSESGSPLADTLTRDDEEMAPHIALNDPADVIARCEAELAILDEHGPAADYPADYPAKCQRCITGRRGYPDEWPDDDYPCRTAHLVASGYRHRPGYGDHWGGQS